MSNKQLTAINQAIIVPIMLFYNEYIAQIQLSFNRRGDMEVKVIGIFIVVLLSGVLLPISFKLIFNANVTGWDSNTKTVFALIPIIAVVAVIIIIVFAYYTRRSD